MWMVPSAKQLIIQSAWSAQCKLCLSDMLVNESYYDHQEYTWFMGGDLHHFEDNFQIV